MHRTNADFWKEYRALPADIRERADKQFALLKTNPRHPSLHFKKLTEHGGQEIWSARVTLKYRALAVRLENDYVWFWVREHGTYDATA
jgi:mRNA-degrading endonuclease RelE of RelBE toxin-antitoxin system